MGGRLGRGLSQFALSVIVFCLSALRAQPLTHRCWPEHISDEFLQVLTDIGVEGDAQVA
jgi:hypothetical protein